MMAVVRCPHATSEHSGIRVQPVRAPVGAPRHHPRPEGVPQVPVALLGHRTDAASAREESRGEEALATDD